MEQQHLKRVDWAELQLPNHNDIAKYVLWGTGRVALSFWLFSLHGLSATCKLIDYLAQMTERATLNLLKVYDQLPYMGTAVQHILDVPSVTVTEPTEIITDIISAIEAKQVMIIGEMGTGKSTLAQYLAYTVGGAVKVYEPEGTPEDWQGLQVIGKGEDWGAIEFGMQADLEDLSNQLKIRNERGDHALGGSEKVIICEEYPELVSKVDCSSEWLERHARRGRKARRFTILLSQYDRVAAWGLEGKSDLADAFYRIRLGKKAVTHAKSLKNDQLVEWLRADRSHCLLDDQPCKLPSYREMKAVTQRLFPVSNFQPVNQLTTTSQQVFQPVEPPDTDLPEAVIRAVRVAISLGASDSKIIKDILGYQGGQYQSGKNVLEIIKSSHA